MGRDGGRVKLGYFVGFIDRCGSLTTRIRCKGLYVASPTRELWVACIQSILSIFKCIL